MENAGNDRTLFYKGLTRKIKILILVVSFFPMCLTTGVLLYRFDTAYTEKIQAHISELVQRHAQNIDTFLYEKLGNIRSLADQFDPQQDRPDLFLSVHMKRLKNEYGDVFTDLGIVDENGIQTAYHGPFKLENADYSNAPWFLNAKGKSCYISDVFAGLRGHPHFIIAVSVPGTLSLLRGTVNFGRFNDLVENLHLGTTGVAYILNGRGKLQTKADIRIDPGIVLDLSRTGTSGPEGSAVMAQQDASGNRYLFAVARLTQIDWRVVFRQDVRDAFHDLHKTQLVAAAIFFTGCIAIVLVAFTLPRYMVGLISKADKKNEEMTRQVVESGKLAAIGELAAGIAHEINNPVAIMVEEAGWIGDLLSEEDLKASGNQAEYNRALSQIHTQGKRCKEITRKLLSFARKGDAPAGDVKVNESILEMVSLTGQMARYSNIIIETQLQEQIPDIRISASELQQVMLNLINNAVDAMARTGGTIKIETAVRSLEKPYLFISVQDTGPGIPKENLGRIFDPFFTTKAVGKGTGLGLSICYGIIRNMGGRIEVTSQAGQGARFDIWIPFPENGKDA